MTSSVRSRTARSALVIDSPAGATSSQCRPLTATPASCAARRNSRAPRGRHAIGIVAERERRHFEPGIAELGRERALARELEFAQHLVAQRKLHRVTWRSSAGRP